MCFRVQEPAQADTHPSSLSCLRQITVTPVGALYVTRCSLRVPESSMRAGGRQGPTWNEVARKFHSPSSAPAAPTLAVLLVSQLRSHHFSFPPAAELPGPSSCMMSLFHRRCRDAIISCRCLTLVTRSTRHQLSEECCQVVILQRHTAGACSQCACACLSLVGPAQRCCPRMHTPPASGRVPEGQSGWLSAPADWEAPSRHTGICRAAPWVSCMGLSSTPASHIRSDQGGRLVARDPAPQCHVQARCLAADSRLTDTSY